MIRDRTFGWFLRQARRDADLSQRQLARYSGVPASTIAAAETGGRDVALTTARILLETCGYQLVILDRGGRLVEEILMDWRRDRGGRRFPAHLDLRSWPLLAGRAGGHKVQPDTRVYTFDLDRWRRDLERERRAAGEGWYDRIEDL
jgi:transcriptional regulator with XRE-family HTH domain